MFSSDILLKQIAERKVYFFSSDKLNTDVPHYFICVTQSDPDNLMAFVCCTTKFKKRAQYHELQGYPQECLLRIKNSQNNGLTEESFVDCTSVFQFTKEEFKAKYESGNLKFKGELEEMYFEQILIGVSKSPRTEKSMRQLAEKMIAELYK